MINNALIRTLQMTSYCKVPFRAKCFSSGKKARKSWIAVGRVFSASSRSFFQEKEDRLSGDNICENMLFFSDFENCHNWNKRQIKMEMRINIFINLI